MKYILVVIVLLVVAGYFFFSTDANAGETQNGAIVPTGQEAVETQNGVVGPLLCLVRTDSSNLAGGCAYGQSGGYAGGANIKVAQY